MPYYKDSNNQLHFLDSTEFAYLLPLSCTEVTDTEAETIRLSQIPPEPPIVVSALQIRKALTQLGLRTAVESAVATGSQDLKDDWEFSTRFIRKDPLIISMAESLGQTPAQVDALFELAQSLA